MRNITYGVDGESFYARCGDRVAFLELDYVNMTKENNFESKYIIFDVFIHNILPDVWNDIRWTKKIPLSIKNQFRKYFKLPELKMTPSYYLVIDIESGKYLSGMFIDKNTYTQSLSKAIKFNTNIELPTITDNIMIVEMK